MITFRVRERQPQADLPAFPRRGYTPRHELPNPLHNSIVRLGISGVVAGAARQSRLEAVASALAPGSSDTRIRISIELWSCVLACELGVAPS